MCECAKEKMRHEVTYPSVVYTRLPNMASDITKLILDSLPVWRDGYGLRYESVLGQLPPRLVDGNG
jgi:hypothetical protein